MLESVVQISNTSYWLPTIDVCGAHNAILLNQENPHIVVIVLYREVGAKN